MDSDQELVRFVDVHLPLQRAFAVAVTADDVFLISEGWSTEDADDRKRGQILAVGLDGRVRWEQPTGFYIRRIIVDAEGTSVVACSPPLDYWDKYHASYSLADECFIACFDAQGQQRWLWQAPGSISPVLAVSVEGQIITVVDGRLFCLD